MGKLAGYGVQPRQLEPQLVLSCVAPPAVRLASVALPACTSFTSAVFEGGICQTLASYVSMQTFPTFTESGGHLSVPAPADSAAARQTAVQPTTMYLRNPVMVLPSLSPASGFPELGR